MGGQAGAGEQRLTQADNGKTITVAPGSRIVVVLPENPTTGFSWAVEKVDPDLSLVSSEHTVASGGGIGGGGNRTLVFEAKAPGAASIRLKRWREFEGEPSVRERYAVGVKVGTG